MAKFNWQEEKEDGQPPWIYDGSSSSRVPRQAGRWSWRRGLKTSAFVFVILAIAAVGSLVSYQDTIKVTGIIEPFRVSHEHIKAPIVGIIHELAASEGTAVKAGDLLAIIWPDELDVLRDVENRKLNHEIALEEIKKVEENLEMIGEKTARLKNESALFSGDASEVSALERNLAAIERELRQRENEEVRARVLHDQKVISLAEYELVVTSRDVAQSQVANLRAEIQALRTEREIKLVQLSREIQQAERQLAVEKINLEQKKKEKEQQEMMLDTARQRAQKMTIYAPWSGRVIRQEKNAGDRVAAGETIMIVSAGKDRQVSIRVRPEDYNRLAVGQRAQILPLAAAERHPLFGEGSVIYVGVYARQDGDSGGQYIPAKIMVETLSHGVPLGTSAEVTIMTGRKRTLFFRNPPFPRSR